MLKLREDSKGTQIRFPLTWKNRLWSLSSRWGMHWSSRWAVFQLLPKWSTKSPKQDSDTNCFWRNNLMNNSNKWVTYAFVLSMEETDWFFRSTGTSFPSSIRNSYMKAYLSNFSLTNFLLIVYVFLKIQGITRWVFDVAPPCILHSLPSS